ncbi:MAG: hypothetical protein HON70_18870 [Lentisphaerae bacterium]|nr:hypothetical protein [Lentisphaerota bacterium]
MQITEGNATPSLIVCSEDGKITSHGPDGGLRQTLDIKSSATMVTTTPCGTAVGTTDGRIFLLP